MADSTGPAEASSAAPKPDVKTTKPPKAPNPVFRMMGLPNMRMRLPSRNWLIFLSITGSFTAAVIYDKRETKRAQKKWAKLVEHVAKEPLNVKEMPRRLTIFLESPPGDGLRSAQDHFREYVKPVLIASGLDWEFVQGRKEGDIRAEVAERIRNQRRPESERPQEDLIETARKQMGVQEYSGPLGDIVIGRHTWKEYVRGLHEGWLGPLTAPPQPEKPVIESPSEEKIETLPGITIHSSAGDEKEKPAPDSDATKKDEKPPRLPPFISTLDYASAATPTELPSDLPSAPISFPHILGFLNTPLRTYRFLHRRDLADQIGRDTAAIILGTYRPYREDVSSSQTQISSASSALSDDASPSQSSLLAEQQAALQEEEKEWHKSVRKHEDGEDERTWLDSVVLDPRIASRMRRFELTPEDEERAARIVVPEEEIEGALKGGLRSLFHQAKGALGFGPPKPLSAAEQVEESLK